MRGMANSSLMRFVEAMVWNSMGSSVRMERMGPYTRHTTAHDSKNGSSSISPPMNRRAPTNTVMPMPACSTN